MKSFGKPILALVVFLVTQGVIGIIGAIINTFTNPNVLAAITNGDKEAVASSAISPVLLATILIVSSIISIILMIWPLKMFNVRKEFTPSGIGIGLSVLAIAAAIVGMYGTNFINEVLDLPNIIEAQLNDMSATIIGALAISVVGPLAEEVVFRGAIMGYMLRKGVNPWVVILFSALLFGLMHINPAQVPFAMIVGVILGVIYYRTGNIILTTIIHIINNSVATILTNVCDDSTKLSDMFGGSMLVTLLAGLVVLAICFAMLRMFWNCTSGINSSEEEMR